jgi:hypothetical protein
VSPHPSALFLTVRLRPYGTRLLLRRLSTNSVIDSIDHIMIMCITSR